MYCSGWGPTPPSLAPLLLAFLPPGQINASAFFFLGGGTQKAFIPLPRGGLCAPLSLLTH